MAYEIIRFPHDGAVDADGHVLEPAWLWREYLEDRHKDKAICIRVDDDGLEYLEIAGRPQERMPHGQISTVGAMGDDEFDIDPARRYMELMPFGAMDADERVSLLDQENLEGSILYPTIGLMWEAEVTDPVLSLAYAGAYNRWIADFCRHTGGRLVPVAQLPLTDPEAAAAELERAVKDGCKGGFVAPFTHAKTAHGDPAYDVLWAKACELDVPVAIHPMIEPSWAIPVRFRKIRPASSFFYFMMVRQGVQQAFLSFFALGTLERFPSLKLGVLESGCGWIGAFLDRMDSMFETGLRDTISLEEKPSTYFERQCFISGDPDETAAPHIIEHVGADNFMWATDYPHPDHPHTWVHALGNFVESLGETTRRKVLGENVKRVYGLD